MCIYCSATPPTQDSPPLTLFVDETAKPAVARDFFTLAGPSYAAIARRVATPSISGEGMSSWVFSDQELLLSE